MTAPVFFQRNVSVLPPVVIDYAAGGDLVLMPGAPNVTTKLYRFLIMVGGATAIKFKDGLIELCGPLPLAANGGLVLDFLQDPWFQGSVNTNFILNSSNAVQVSGAAWMVQSSP